MSQFHDPNAGKSTLTVPIVTLLVPPVGMMILPPLWPLFAFVAPFAALVSAAILSRSLRDESPGNKLLYSLGIIAVCLFVEGILCVGLISSGSGSRGLPIVPTR